MYNDIDDIPKHMQILVCLMVSLSTETLNAMLLDINNVLNTDIPEFQRSMLIGLVDVIKAEIKASDEEEKEDIILQ